MDRATLEKLNALRARRIPVVVVTAMADGRTRLVTEDGTLADPLHGELESRLRSGKSGVAQTEEGELFFGVHLPPPRLAIIGAVHITQTLAPLTSGIGFDVTVIDPRTAFATQDRFPGVTLLDEWPEQVMPGLQIDRFTAVAALTHVPDIDDFALLHAVTRGCFYTGALGSRKTHARRLERLARAGATPDQLETIKSPIGLDIGAASPAEIAVAIAAEIISALRQRQIG